MPSLFDQRPVRRPKHSTLGKKDNRHISSADAKLRDYQRRQTLLAHHKNRNNTNLVQDRRFDAQDQQLSQEDRIIRQMQRERAKEARQNLFALQDDTSPYDLTHQGKALGEMQDDELGRAHFSDASDDEAVGTSRQGFGGVDFVKSVQFGGGSSDAYQRQRDALNETIAKHKLAKLERREKRDGELSLLNKLDADFVDYKNMIFEMSASAEATAIAESRAAKSRAGDFKANTSTTAPLSERRSHGGNAEWGSLTKLLAQELRAQPTTRLKSEAEVAAAEQKRLQLLERERIQRMAGESSSEVRRSTDDDLFENYEPSMTASLSTAGIGANVDERPSENGANDEVDSGEDEENGEDDASDDDECVLKQVVDRSIPGMDPNDCSDLPYVLSLPKNSLELNELFGLARGSSKRLREILHRLIAGHHVKLRDKNTEKLSALATLLLRRLLRVIDSGERCFSIEPGPLTSALYSICVQIPLEAGRLIRAKLISNRALWIKSCHAANRESNKDGSNGTETSHANVHVALPPPALALLSLSCQLFPVTDYRHPVLTPCTLWIGEALRQKPLPSDRLDLRRLLFTAGCAFHLSSPACRFVPELVDCVFRLMRGLFGSSSVENPTWSLHLVGEIVTARTVPKFLGPMTIGSLVIRRAEDEGPLSIAEATAIYDLVQCSFLMCSKVSSACDLLLPFLQQIEAVDRTRIPTWLVDLHNETCKLVSKALEVAKATREPLRLQRVAPVPIKQLNPVFDMDFQPGSSAASRDPDRERAEAQKLRRQLKKEHKGAVRELRKDASLLASARAEERQEKTDYLEARGKRAVSLMEEQEANWKSQKKEKRKVLKKML